MSHSEFEVEMYHFRNNHAQSFLVGLNNLKIIILHNFLKIHIFAKIFTHVSMGDSFFSYGHPFASQEPEYHLARRHIVSIYILYVRVGLE